MATVYSDSQSDDEYIVWSMVVEPDENYTAICDEEVICEAGYNAVFAKATFRVSYVSGVVVYQEVTGPGLYGVEADASPEYLEEVYEEQKEELKHILRRMGVLVKEGGLDAI